MPSEALPLPIEVALLCGEALERLGIGYFLGGSLASSLQGEHRATNHVDLVVDLHEGEVARLAQELGTSFDVDEDSLRDAVGDRSSWNIFHLPSALKVDLFILRDGPFDRSEFGRRRALTIAPGRTLHVKTPEDTVLRKLLWFRQGGEVASQQWRDVVHVLRVSAATLDLAHAEAWARSLGVEDLLERARHDAR
jgi:hypothetical protein